MHNWQLLPGRERFFKVPRSLLCSFHNILPSSGHRCPCSTYVLDLEQKIKNPKAVIYTCEVCWRILISFKLHQDKPCYLWGKEWSHTGSHNCSDCHTSGGGEGDTDTWEDEDVSDIETWFSYETGLWLYNKQVKNNYILVINKPFTLLPTLCNCFWNFTNAVMGHTVLCVVDCLAGEWGSLWIHLMPRAIHYRLSRSL